MYITPTHKNQFMRKTKTAVLLLTTALLVQFCKKSTDPVHNPDPVVSVLNLPATPYNYSNVVFPQHIANNLALNDNTPATNPITDDGATLGRVLFYDKNLSANNTISCASCHKQSSGFTDNLRFSAGFDGGLTTRTSMNTLNLRFYRSGKMFWDERAATLEEQVLMPIQNHVEMGMTLTDLVTKLQGLSYYADLFQNAFGSSVIDTIRISRALSQFLRSMVTYQAKYDKVKQGLENFTLAESMGEQLFLNASPGPGTPTCATCHTPPMFMNSAAPPFSLLDDNDLGINNERRFKSGSLRNITTTTNLFHNGSIQDVQAMLAGIPNPIPAHTVAPPDRANILAFLQTLTDNTITTDVRFSNPFR